MPTLNIPYPSQYLPYRPLSWDWAARPPLQGSAGQELAKLEEKLLAYWRLSCEQIHVLREIDELISYEPIPPKRTFMVPIRYYLRGRGEPLVYQIVEK